MYLINRNNIDKNIRNIHDYQIVMRAIINEKEFDDYEQQVKKLYLVNRIRF